MSPSRTCLLLASAVSLCLFGGIPLSADTIHVPADQPTIQAGIDAARDGDTVLVSDGTWTGAGNREIEFGGKAITLMSENGPAACIVDCGDGGPGFLFTSGETLESVLDGFTIRDGYGDPGGGAIQCISSSPTIRNNVMEENGGYYAGGAMHVESSAALIEDNLFSGNYLIAAGGGAGGCGLYISGAPGPTVTGNRFEDNETVDAWGGALRVIDADPRVEGNLFSGNRALFGAAAAWSGGAQGLVLRNEFTGNAAGWGGGAVMVYGASPIFEENIFSGNRAETRGGALLVEDGSATLVRNTFSGNETLSGGAVHLIRSDVQMRGDRLQDNSVSNLGGGILAFESALQVENALLVGNLAMNGAGLRCIRSEVEIRGCTMDGNSAAGPGGAISGSGGSLVVTNSILWENLPTEVLAEDGLVPAITWSDISGGFPGTGNINVDPLFAAGPGGENFLSHLAAGQDEDSVCIDAGDPAGAVPPGTTRTDQVPDIMSADMGYHYPAEAMAVPSLVTGPGPSPDNPPLVRVFPPAQGAEPLFEYSAYGADGFGVNVAAGDLDGDGGDEVVTGAGPGEIYGPHVRGFSVEGTPLPGLNFVAYGTPRWGVNVAAGNLDGLGGDEIITGAGPGAVFGPHVRAFSWDGTGVASLPGVNFFAYGTPRYGVNVAAGDLDGDGMDEIVTGAGPGALFGPHVRGWNVDGGTAAPLPGVSFFAYGTLRYGVRVSCGDVDGDGIDELVTGPGPSARFGAHLRGWDTDGNGVTPLPGFSFFAWPPSEARYGAGVWAGTDLDNDGRDEIIAVPGPDPSFGSPVKVFSYDGDAVTWRFTVDAYPGGWTHGATVAAGWFRDESRRPVTGLHHE